MGVVAPTELAVTGASGADGAGDVDAAGVAMEAPVVEVTAAAGPTVLGAFLADPPTADAITIVTTTTTTIANRARPGSARYRRHTIRVAFLTRPSDYHPPVPR